MVSLPPYIPRKNNPIAQSISEPVEFLALDWYECDLLLDKQIDRKSSYLNQEHNKTYTIFIFGVTSKGHSICLRVKNYLPYFYVQIPDEFTPENTQDFLNCFNVSGIEDYDEDELEQYTEAIAKRDYKFVDTFKQRSRYYVDSINPDSTKTKIVDKKVFWTFMNEQKFNFAKLAFKSKIGYQFMEKAFKSPMLLPIKDNYKTPIKYNLFESDLEPVLRFMHDKKIKPSSWLQIPANKYKIENKQSKTQINISCDWNELQPLDKAEIPPLLIASFDIEADSSHGDFPIPRKDCKKLANQLVIAWIRDQRIIEKKAYDKILQSKSTNNTSTISIPENLIYTDNKDFEYDNSILPECETFLGKLQIELQQKQDELFIEANKQNNEPIILKPTKEIIYLREVIKYIKAKHNIVQGISFYDYRIRKSLGYEEYSQIDNDIDLLYLKRPIKAKVFLKSPEYIQMIKKIYTICNRSIRKIKANTIMKKALKEISAIETAKLAKSSRFNLDDLIKIINDVSRKYKIPERDLQDKIITKETMVRFVNNELNRAFGFAQGDTVIQIGTVFWRYGEANICHNNIITLKSCAPFDIGENPCEIISHSQERDVLQEWASLIDKHDPDIIIGYNTFGFDESFMYDRITDIALPDIERITLTKEDLKLLEVNPTYQKFINLGRFDPEIVKRVNDTKGGIVNKKLSSSALGDNFMYYFNMPGRVQIDLLKVCQASLTKLPSYKLDSVSEFYISGKIKDVILDNPENNKNNNIQESYNIKVDNINELDIGNYIVISMSATTAKLYDGEKLKILDIDKINSKITLDKPIPKNCLSSIPLWGLGKDDISPQDIFRLQKGNSHDRATIAKYCIQDCALLIRLLRKLEVINNNFGMSNVCLVPFSYIFLRGQGIKAFSLITNECAKEDFLLPVLEKIEPEEIEVDDTTRRNHIQIALQTETADDGDDLLEDDNIILETTNKTNNNNENDDEDILDDETDNDEILEEDIYSENTNKSIKCKIEQQTEIHPSQMKFKLPKNFNQIIMTDESYEGALVLKPITDIYTEDPITVLDFSSLYPSEMITSDLSHDRICEDPYWLGENGAKHLEQLGLSYIDRSYDNYEWIDPKKRSKGKRKCGITKVRFVQYPDGRKGLIPRILMGLLASRKATKKKMDAEPDPFKKALYDGLQLAYKITANSVYGQIGARTSKMYKPQIAASTTAGGRKMIQTAREFFCNRFGATITYGDTDSLFLKLKLLRGDGTPPTNEQEKILLAIQKGQEAEKELKKILPGVHCMAYEKVLFPFILISKKRYFALKYEDDPTKYKQISMGLVLKRRDNAPILKHCYIGVLDSIVKERSITKAIEFIHNECKKMVDEKFDMNMFVISKTLSSYYKDPESIAHAILAQRMSERDPGNKPQSNERIPYVFIKIKEEPGIDYLQGDRIEHINYVRQHKLKPDYEKYILNQIMKPISQLFELVVEKIPNFPHGKGYYNELYNIWYNKYDGDEMKTEKKIKQLKAQMVQKLIFDPLIQYARIKASKNKTIDEWFIPQYNIEHTQTIAQPKVKPQHNINIKKSKQLSLDAFFS
jgi:DNA polymerase elongation subunit (family B)